MTAPPTPATESAPERPPSWRSSALIIAAMLLAFVLVVVFRQEIRVRWWGYRLARSAAPADRLYYTQLLLAARQKALPVARDLMAVDDPAVRSYGVVLLNGIPGDAAFALLRDACHDADAAVRESAMHGLSVRDADSARPTLLELTAHDDLMTAMVAVNRLESSAAPEAARAICDLARQSSRAGVRAQAIQSLAVTESGDAIDTLIACLGDNAVFEGETATERAIRETVALVGPNLPGGIDLEGEAGIFGPPGETNGARAARALHALTGEDFGYLTAPPEQQPEIIESWRTWRRTLSAP